MIKKICYIFTIPASILFYIAELITGEKIGWRCKESFKESIKEISCTCTKCGHKGKLHALDDSILPSPNEGESITKGG